MNDLVFQKKIGELFGIKSNATPYWEDDYQEYPNTRDIFFTIREQGNISFETLQRLSKLLKTKIINIRSIDYNEYFGWGTAEISCGNVKFPANRK